MTEHTLEAKEKKKGERSNKAKNLLKEKGGEMNKAEKDYVGHFVKKDGQPSSEISKEKAKKMLKEGEANGKPLSKKQKGMLGAAAGRGE